METLIRFVKNREFRREREGGRFVFFWASVDLLSFWIFVSKALGMGRI
jgi:hypothetical protein